MHEVMETGKWKVETGGPSFHSAAYVPQDGKCEFMNVNVKCEMWKVNWHHCCSCYWNCVDPLTNCIARTYSSQVSIYLYQDIYYI
jgi:hypothetical protein